MKFLTLMNPSGKLRNRRKVMATKSRPKARSRSRARRVVARRPAPPKMTPAMRRKVSLGVRRYFAARKAKRASVAVARPVAVARRRPSYSAPARRPARRPSSSFGGISTANPLKSLLSKDTLKLAGGAVAAGVASEYVLNKWGDKLPGLTGANAPYVQTVYRGLIPLGAAYFVRKWDRRVAEGLVVGAAVMVLNDIIRLVMNRAGSFERMGLAGELSGFAASAPSPAKIAAINRVRAARSSNLNGFRGTVEDLQAAPGSAAFSRSAF